MKINTAFAIAALVGTSILPVIGNAQSRYDRNNDRRNDSRYDRRSDTRYDRSESWRSPRQEADRRQQTKNEWRNLAIGSGALSVLGLLQKDKTLFFGGAAGALYSAYRYEQDRKSQSKLERGRASFFDRDHFYRDGVRYERRTVTKGGQRYFQFQRGR